ncbi:MAG: hypothetical protein NVSMB63_05470 [Sediminibacterium sp.]
MIINNAYACFHVSIGLTGNEIITVVPSTGGLIVSCLTLRDERNPHQPKYNLQQVAEIYQRKGREIFPVQ